MPVRELEEGLRMYVDRHRPFQKFCGLYLFATNKIATAESDWMGYMPIVEAGKCSAVDEAKDLWRERMRSAFCESRGCCCVLDAFCTESASSSNSAQDNTYLSSIVDLEGSLAGSVEVSSVT